MTEGDPRETHRDLFAQVASELRTAGFDDAHEIGHGGFGVVYRCKQSDLDRTVAVKVLAARPDDENTARFVREQRAMGRLSGHPNIVNVLQIGTLGSGRPYIVMQYHPQNSIDTRIREHGPLDLEDTLHLGVKMAGALETAHRLGILHRDVKPANILLTEYGEPALADFGIARISGGFETATGTITGSPAFTAPEVLRGGPSSPASDVYGLGATLFCALTGHAVFERRSGEQMVAQFVRITTQPVPDVRKMGIPDDVSTAIERAMARDPEDRPSAAEFGDQLRQIERRRGFSVDQMVLHTSPAVTGISARTGDIEDPGLFHGPENEISGLISLRVRAGKLPLELTSFINRRHELTEIKRLLSISRLVTLTGMGGVGKTRLALRVAADVEHAFEDGVWLIELGELRDASLLIDVVAASLGLRGESTQSTLDVVTEFLASRQILILLDNCEHLVDAVAHLTHLLLRNCLELRILATSRESIAINGEAVLRILPLAVPDSDRLPSLPALSQYDAVTLFAERAAAAVPGFMITEHNKDAVAQICRRLDGMPLPLELAAARLRALSVDQILERLTDRYALLNSGNRGAPTRQQTLRMCIDWSYELCTPREQRVWSRLSVFSGGFELDAAEGVCAEDMSPADLIDAIGSLTDKSILIREETGRAVRFRLLETVREYGLERLRQTSRYETLRRRHRDWFRQLVVRAEAEWISARQLDWIARLDREQPNLREALEFCLTEPDEAEAGLQIAAALHNFWLARGLLGEGRLWFRRLLSLSSEEPTEEMLRVLLASIRFAALQGDLLAAAEETETCQDMADLLGGPSARALAAHATGTMAMHDDDLPLALACFKSAAAGFRADSDPLRLIPALLGLVVSHGVLGNVEQAICNHEEIMALTAPQGESRYRAYSLFTLARVMWKQNPTRSVELLEESLRLMRQLDDPIGSASCVETLAWIAAESHSARRAAVLLGAADALRRAAGTSMEKNPQILAQHAECEQRTRQMLGWQKFDTTHRDGAALSFREIVAYVLDEKIEDRATVARTATTTLTKRERQVADLISQGLTNKEIATKLAISQRTVEGHVGHILTKLAFTSRAQIAVWVVEQLTTDRQDHPKTPVNCHDRVDGGVPSTTAENDP
ncbi:protein kinase domain-containing protein [Rhodococcus rhodochrous]|uniref:protein kinase domain-containing protein n=1 Tax=Rhodococcus rhodochrous TaxID=1829 RepID=UPI0002FBFB3A|nr:protein kinase [Rhodococcus rhodochrous]